MAARTMRLAAMLVAGASLAACATTGPQLSSRAPAHRGKDQASPGYKVGAPYQVGGIWYVPREQPNYNEVGTASWYGDAFHMKSTANGEIFDKGAVTAAHTTLPLPSLVEVTNLDNGRKLTVRVNDRGPFVDGRIIDLSHEAARQLGYDQKGLARVRVRYLGPAPLYNEDTRRFARYVTPAPQPTPAAAPPPPPKVKEPEVVFTSAPLPKAKPIEIIQSSLAPLAGTSPTPARSASAAFRVQVGAFSTQESARRVAARVASSGYVVVEPVDRNGATLYRVVLDDVADEDQAEQLRQQVAGIGFPSARVIRPF